MQQEITLGLQEHQMVNFVLLTQVLVIHLLLVHLSTRCCLTNITGTGRDATADITISNGVAVAATISQGGTGYVIGDVLSADQIGTQTLGRNLQLSVQATVGHNEIILDNM